MRKFLLLILLLFPVLSFAQDDPDPPSRFAPQEEKNLVPIKFYIIPEFVFGAAFEDQTISNTTTEPFAQIRIPGLVLPGLNSTSTGFAVEFTNPDGVGSAVMMKFMSYTRVPVAGGFFTGVDVEFARGQQNVGTEQNFAGTAIVGFKLLSVADDKATLSIELGLFTPNEPVKIAAVVGF